MIALLSATSNLKYKGIKMSNYESVKKFKNKKIKMIPYYLWANRNAGEMKVWFTKN